eukprot:14912-Eustigmatos_ZCMA.PRE.1
MKKSLASAKLLSAAFTTVRNDLRREVAASAEEWLGFAERLHGVGKGGPDGPRRFFTLVYDEIWELWQDSRIRQRDTQAAQSKDTPPPTLPIE